MDRVISKMQTAYCPKFDEQRTIFMGLIIHPALAKDFFRIDEFDCEEETTCEYLQNNGECPFITAVVNRYCRC